MRLGLRPWDFGLWTLVFGDSWLGWLIGHEDKAQSPKTQDQSTKFKARVVREFTMSIITEVIQSTKAIIQGMGVTLSYIPKRKWTVQYPEEPVTVQPRYRGQHLLHVDELGREKCVACFLCAAACPSECIYIVAKDDPRLPEERIGVDERYAEVYNIDYGRCIFCGYCVEACPKDAITHGYNFELSVYNRADLLKTKDDLLITKQVQSRNYRVASSTEDVDSEYKEV